MCLPIFKTRSKRRGHPDKKEILVHPSTVSPSRAARDPSPISTSVAVDDIRAQDILSSPKTRNNSRTDQNPIPSKGRPVTMSQYSVTSIYSTDERPPSSLERTVTAAATSSSAHVPYTSFYDLEQHNLHQKWEQAHKRVWRCRQSCWNAQAAVREAHQRVIETEREIADAQDRLLEAEKAENAARLEWEDVVARRE
jgi:hypothetical protein